jgi:hypothetical protein
MELGFVDSGQHADLTNRPRKNKERLTITNETQLDTTQCIRNGGAQFKVKVLSCKIRFCNTDSDTHLTRATAYAQTLTVIEPPDNFVI